MLALAGIPLGLSFRFLDPSPDAPAAEVGELLVGDYDDPELLDRLAEGAEVVTYEFENVPVAAARRVSAIPAAVALEAAQDRLVEKQLFRRLGIPTARIDDEVEVFPALLKSRFLGYDGKGQRLVEDPSGTVPGHVLEQRVAFRPGAVAPLRPGRRRRDTFLAARRKRARGRDPAAPRARLRRAHRRRRPRSMRPGSSTSSPMWACSRSSSSMSAGSCSRTRSHRGCTTQVTGRSKAPRPASSRTTCARFSGCRSGRRSPRRALLVNLIAEVPTTLDVLEIPGAHLHLYGKEPRPGRKLGHVTLVNPSSASEQKLLKLAT